MGQIKGPALFLTQLVGDEVLGTCCAAGVEISELSTQQLSQLMPENPAYELAFDDIAGGEVNRVKTQ